LTSRKRDPRFDDGVPVRSDSSGRWSRSGSDRKTHQLCAQVRRALELTLIGLCEDPILQDVLIHDVRPAPRSGGDGARLLVSFQCPDGVSPEVVLERIEASRALWRSEIAQAISRRRLPEIGWDVVIPDDS
jgi:ribosome-binding factor A